MEEPVHDKNVGGDHLDDLKEAKSKTSQEAEERCGGGVVKIEATEAQGEKGEINNLTGDVRSNEGANVDSQDVEIVIKAVIENICSQLDLNKHEEAQKQAISVNSRTAGDRFGHVDERDLSLLNKASEVNATSSEMTKRSSESASYKCGSNESSASIEIEAQRSPRHKRSKSRVPMEIRLRKFCPFHPLHPSNNIPYPCGDFEMIPTNLLSCNGLYVSNIAPKAHRGFLRQIFRSFGTVVNSRVCENGNGSATAYFSYDNPHSPVKAIMTLKNVIFDKEIAFDCIRPFELRFAPSQDQRKTQFMSRDQARRIVEAAGECFWWRNPFDSCRSILCESRHVRVNYGIDMPWKPEP